MTKPSSNDAAADIVHGFNPYVHGARGLFAAMIVVFHVVNSRLATASLLAHGWPLFIARSTEHGVELFFGISGMVIVGALARARAPWIFALERATRIYPVLWASIAAIVALSALTGFKNVAPGPLTLIANLLALPPLIPGPLLHPAAWSLSYELAFYGLCALAWALRRRLGWAAWLLIAPVSLVALAWHVRAILMPVGMGVAFALTRRSSQPSAIARAPGFWLCIFLLLWEAVCEGSGGDLTPMNVLQLPPGLIGLGLLAAAAAAMAFRGILAGAGWFSVVLASRPLQFLGTISYSLYLWHPIVMSGVKHAMFMARLPSLCGDASQLIFLLLSAPPSILLAWVSQRLLEKRVTRWLRRRLEGRAARADRQLAPMTAVHPTLKTPAEAGS